MVQNTLKGISKSQLYNTLTNSVYDKKGSHISVSDIINIDTSIESEMDRAFILIKKMERRYSKNDLLAEYYRSDFQEIDKAYIHEDPEKFKEALQSLIDSIDMQ